MKKYKVEIYLNLSDESAPLDWVFNAIGENLEYDKGETISGKWIELTENEGN